MHCQRETARAILGREADYVLGIKANRFAMYDDAVLFLDDTSVRADSAAQTVDADHGRIETRRARVVADATWLAERYAFPGLKALGEVTATREIGRHPDHDPPPVRLVPAHDGRGAARHRLLSLGHRERAALGPGRRVR